MKKSLLLFFLFGFTLAFAQNIETLTAEAEGATGVAKAQKYIELTEAYRTANKWVQAEINARKAVQFANQTTDTSVKISAFNILGRTLARNGKFSPADYNLKQSLYLAQQSGNPEELMSTYDALRYLNQIRRRSSLELKYERLYKGIQDSLAKINSDKVLAELKQKNESDAEARAAEVAAAQQAEKSAKSRLVSLLTIAGIIVAASLAAIFLTFVFFQRKLTKHKKENKAQQNRFANIVRAQEMDKVSSVALLFDEVEEPLENAQKQLKAIIDSNSELEDVEEINYLVSQVKKAKEGAAELGFSILPKVLMDKGMAPALQQLVKRKDKLTATEVSFRSTPLSFNISKDGQVILYRIIHDILDLLMQQSKADFIDVAIQQENKTYTFEITHNGLGWEADALQELENFHWDSLQSKINFLNGQLKVVKKEPRGNDFIITVPEQRIVRNEEEPIEA